MSEPDLIRALRVLAVGSPPPAWAADHCKVETAGDLAEAMVALGGDTHFDAIVLDGDGLACSAREIEALVARTVLVVAVVEPDAEHALGWLHCGAEDVLGRDELAGSGGARRLRFAVERGRRSDARQAAYSTDPGTGLPHRQQLVEHLSQLLALREREPAPMAVLALRIEGLGAHDGSDATRSEVLRRKIAVRLRAGVRASDVVAAVGADAFVVLLGAILAPGDAERVAEKLVAALVAPFAVAGLEHSVAVAVGIGHYPQDGKEAERLLRRSLALAAAAPAAGQAGSAAAHDASGTARVAANDDA